jgi:hypothetical protein
MSETTSIDQSTQTAIDEVKKKVSELLNLSEMEDLVKSNEKIFDIDGQSYRVRKPNFKEKQEVYRRRIEKFTELIKNPAYMLEKDLIATYRTRGIDMDKIDGDFQSKVARRDELMLKLGEAIKNQTPEFEWQIYRKEIEELNAEIQNISINKTSLLEFSVENQVLVTMFNYVTFLVTEKKIGDSWVKVWNNYTEYENDSSNVPSRAAYYATMIANINEY